MTQTSTAKTEAITATQHRIDLIIWRTAEIAEAEAQSDWNGALLSGLYAARLSHVTEALAMGVAPSFISMITNVGRD